MQQATERLPGVSSTFFFCPPYDDRKDSPDVVNRKLQDVKKTVLEQVHQLNAVTDCIQKNKPLEIARARLALNEIEGKMAQVAKLLYGVCGIDKQIPLQDKEVLSELFVESKKIELELGLILKRLTIAKKFCDSLGFRKNLKPIDKSLDLPKAQLPEEALTRFAGFNPTYGFWKNVSYSTKTFYTLPSSLGGGYYQATGALGCQLEARVGQKLSSLLSEVEKCFIDFCSWTSCEDIVKVITDYQNCLNTLYSIFMELVAPIDQMEVDALSLTLFDYVDLLKQTFAHARSNLKMLHSFTEKPFSLVLRAIHGVQANLVQADNDSEFASIATLYTELEHMTLTQALRSECVGKKFKERFLSRTIGLLTSIHATRDRSLLELNPREQLVFGMLLVGYDESKDMVVMSYLAKRMVSYLYFQPHENQLLDIELELALHMCVVNGCFSTFRDNEAFKRIFESYEKLIRCKQIHSKGELEQAIFIAQAIVRVEHSIYPVYGYLRSWQMYLEFATKLVSTLGKEKTKPLRGLLKQRLMDVSNALSFTYIDPKVQNYKGPISLELSQAPQTQNLQKQRAVLFNSYIIQRCAAALYASEFDVRIAAHRQIVAIIEDARFESMLLELNHDVRQMLVKNTMQKVVAVSCCSQKLMRSQILGRREIRLLANGAFESFNKAPIASIDVAMVLYKLIVDELAIGETKVLTELVKSDLGESDFARWYSSMDDLYRKNKLIEKQSESFAKPGSQCIADEVLASIANQKSNDVVLSEAETAIWDLVLSRQDTNAEDMGAIIPKLKACLAKYVGQALQTGKTCAHLELLLHNIKGDSSKIHQISLYEACKSDVSLYASLLQYEKVFQDNRSDILLQEAAGVMLVILKALKSSKDMFSYAHAVQKCIEFLRDADLHDCDNEQHKELVALLYSKLDMVALKSGQAPLSGSYRYCSIATEPIAIEEEEWIALESQSRLLRLLACCLYGTQVNDRRVAQQCLTTMLQQDIPDFNGLTHLLMENTMNKIIKGDFAVTLSERAFFIEGPLQTYLKQIHLKNDLEGPTQIKVSHALFFLIMQERASGNDVTPITDMFLQYHDKETLGLWYNHYQQFLVSGPIAQDILSLHVPAYERSQWQSHWLKSKDLTEVWPIIHS